ncbi:membrane protein insertion efficiency factor YidD [Candidatus Woesebacteria bacterium]|nr:MAG: membrane protein insertion efficiency factor YidD [Candidatus Woesebacteria bacterium]
MKNINTTFHKIYKNIFSKTLRFLFGGGCRYSPTCSEYSKEALEKFGLAKGTWMSIRRLSRCHPFSKAGFYDPLPSK